MQEASNRRIPSVVVTVAVTAVVACVGYLWFHTRNKKRKVPTKRHVAAHALHVLSQPVKGNEAEELILPPDCDLIRSCSAYEYMLADRPFTVIVCSDSKATAEAVTLLLEDLEFNQSINSTEDAMVNGIPWLIGMDAEWVSNGPIALLQLSSETVCVLIQMQRLTEMPSELKDLLSNKKIIKTGVAIDGDAKRLSQGYGLEVRGCVDVRGVVERMGDGYQEFAHRGLHKLVHEILDADLLKDMEVRCGNWEEPDLELLQILYASADSFFSREIFQVLFDEKFKSDDGKRSMKTLQSTFWSWVKGLVDVTYVASKKQSSGTPTGKSSNRKDPELQAQKALKKIAPRKTPLYENCKIYAPDGTLLCTVNEKKIRWYLEHEEELAVELPRESESDPIAIQLKFNPKGPGHAGDDFYLSEKHNHCVVCGHEDKYIRFRVIPGSYRKFFPDGLKSHSSHDIVLLCPPCAVRANAYVTRMQSTIAEEYDIPLGGQVIDEAEVKKYTTFIKIRSLSFKLESEENLPPARQVRFYTDILSYIGTYEPELIFEGDQESAEATQHYQKVIRGIVSREFPLGMKQKPQLKSHGELVVEKIMSQPTEELCKTELKKFIRKWRVEFLENMKPAFLSPHWSVDHEDISPDIRVK
jgi:hypothetical protein